MIVQVEWGASWMRTIVAAVVSGLVLAAAGTSASAAIMVTRLGGDWNDNPGRTGWSVEFKYDTSKLELDDDGTTQLYSWSKASGAPSAIEYAKGGFGGHTVCDGWDDTCVEQDLSESFHVTEFDTFAIQISEWWAPNTYGILFWMSAENFSLSGGDPVSFRPKIDEPLYLDTYGDYGSALINGNDWGMIHTHVVDTKLIGPSPAAVPEPATWAMLLLGFFGASAALRRSRGISRGDVPA
jgi:hypothetical protein